MTTTISIPEQTQNAWDDLRNQIMGNPNSVMNKTNDWVGLFIEGLNEVIWPSKVSEAALSGAMGLAPGVITAIPKPFRSEVIERVRKYAPSFSKKATGQEILEQLEYKGVIPKGYGGYYLPQSGVGSMQSEERLLKQMFNEGSPNLTRNQLVPYLEENWVNPRIDVKSKSGSTWALAPKKNQRGLTLEDALRRTRNKYELGFLDEAEYNAHLSFARDYPENYLAIMNFNRQPNRHVGYPQSDYIHPQYQSVQTLFKNPTDYFELLLTPRRGLNIPNPDKLVLSGHWSDPSVLTHVRGERMGPELIIGEVQGDWNRVLRKATHLSYDPIYIPQFPSEGLTPGYIDFLNKNKDALLTMGLVKRSGNKTQPTQALREASPGYYAPAPYTDRYVSKHVYPFNETDLSQYRMAYDYLYDRLLKQRKGLGYVPPLPPEFSGSWPEVGAKTALAYGARDPSVKRVSFVDEIIAAATRDIDPYQTQGIYGDRLPQFLRKYAPRYGGEYEYRPGGLRPYYRQLPGHVLFFKSKQDHIKKLLSGGLHTVELGDWNSPFRKFLRGQQPIAAIGATGTAGAATRAATLNQLFNPYQEE